MKIKITRWRNISVALKVVFMLILFSLVATWGIVQVFKYDDSRIENKKIAWKLYIDTHNCKMIEKSKPMGGNWLVVAHRDVWLCKDGLKIYR